MELSEKIKKIETYFANKYIKTINEYFDNAEEIYMRENRPDILRTIFKDNCLYLMSHFGNRYDITRFSISDNINDPHIMNKNDYISIYRYTFYEYSRDVMTQIKEYSDDMLFEFFKTRTDKFSIGYASRCSRNNASNYDAFLYSEMHLVYNLFKCIDCGKITIGYKARSVSYKNGMHYRSCNDCVDKYYKICDGCGRYHRKEEMTILYDDSVVCNDCLNNANITTPDAFDENHKILRYRSGYINDFGWVCKKSIKEHKNEIVKCSLCGDYVKVENSKLINKKRVCNHCLNDKHTEIKSYHNNPKRAYFYDDKVALNPKKFKGFGLELEVQKTDGGDTKKAREEIKNILGDDPYQKLYFMRDGSIGSSGFEIITQPHSEKDLLKIDWEKILSKLTKLGYRSHNGNNCGLHIHSSRNLYGDTKEEQDDNIAKVIYFYEKNFDDLFKFSRRTSSYWCKPYKETLSNNWLGRACGYSGEMTESVCKAIVGHNQNRYQTVNITNKKTIEFRIFRGTLCLNSFLSALDLTFNIVRNCKNISWEDIDDTHKWLAGINDTTKDYIKRRNCFVEVIE